MSARGDANASLARWPAQARSKSVSLARIDPKKPFPDWVEPAGLDVAGAEPACPLAQALADGAAAYWIRASTPHGRQLVGAAAGQLRNDVLIWRWLAVQPPYRAFGFGGAAVPLLERAAARLGAQRAAVLAPAANGVALYFWLRLGYAPQRAILWPSSREGTWMLRELRA